MGCHPFQPSKVCSPSHRLLQAGDLRRLLEMYIGWQHRIFPYAPFDVFVEGLEKLGSSLVHKMQPHSPQLVA